jgi:hypothetical protein
VLYLLSQKAGVRSDLSEEVLSAILLDTKTKVAAAVGFIVAAAISLVQGLWIV